MTRTGSTSELVSARAATVRACLRLIESRLHIFKQLPSPDTSTCASTSVSATCRSCTVDPRTEVSVLRTTEMRPVR